jgi:hypothetical protein
MNALHKIILIIGFKKQNWIDVTWLTRIKNHILRLLFAKSVQLNLRLPGHFE